MQITKEAGAFVVSFEPGEISFVPEVGKGVIGIRFAQGIGDFFRGLPPVEKVQVQDALGAALVAGIELATSRLVRAEQGISAQIPGLKVVPE